MSDVSTSTASSTETASLGPWNLRCDQDGLLSVSNKQFTLEITPDGYLTLRKVVMRGHLILVPSPSES